MFRSLDTPKLNLPVLKYYITLNEFINYKADKNNPIAMLSNVY